MAKVVNGAVVAIRGNFVMQPDYELTDVGYRLHFVNDNPGGGNPSDYYIPVSFAEMSNINQNQLRTLCTTRLAEAFGIGNAVLNSFAGQVIAQ